VSDAAGDVTAAAPAGAGRMVEIQGQQWVARLAGAGAAGSGSLGLGMLEAVRFCTAEAPTTPVREVLLERGRFHQLFDSELVALFTSSRLITYRTSIEETH
jgi:hypothetical protein